MPTTRPRHSITETPPVQEALDELRAELGTVTIDLSELVVLGVREKMRQLRIASPAALAARDRLAERIVRGDVLVDIEAADEVKRLHLLS